MKLLKSGLIAAVLAFSMSNAVYAADMFIVVSTNKSVDQVVTAVKKYSKDKKWKFIGATKVKKGKVTLVKTCIPAIGKLVWPQGLKYSAMLPCGNLGVYTKKGKTQVSMLSAEYMHKLVPTDAMAKASSKANVLLKQMLDEIVK